MSLARILGIARSALLAHQQAMSVTANNIANAQTAGYSRQRLILQAIGGDGGSRLAFGGGVRAGHLERIRDSFFDTTYWRESGPLGTAVTTRQFLEGVETAVNEPSEFGVGAALDGMFQAFGDLANAPSDQSSREGVRRAAQQFVTRMRSLDTAIRGSLDEANARLSSQVDEVNEITRQIAELNGRIADARAGGREDPALLDQRDLLVDRLSELVQVEVRTAGDGTLTITAGGTALVNQAASLDLHVETLPGGGSAVAGPDGGALALTGGSIKALTDLASHTLPDFLARLDTLAATVVTEVNTLHQAGYTLDGRSGQDFFAPAGTTARTIALSADVLTSTASIAAGLSPQEGDGGNALALAGLRDSRLAALGDQTAGGFYTGFVASIGLLVREAGADESAAQAMVDAAATRRASVSGVSIDEEMVNMIGEQEAYAAAARLISVADQMVQELLQVIR